MKRIIYCIVAVALFSVNARISAASYVFHNDDELNAFYNAQSSRIAVDNLTLTGRISAKAISSLSDVIHTVNGTFKAEDLVVTYPPEDEDHEGKQIDWYDIGDQFLRNITLNGSIIFRRTGGITKVGAADGLNNDWVVEPDPAKPKEEVFRSLPAVVKGDLIFEDNAIVLPSCDGWDNWNAWGQVTEVQGDFKIHLNREKNNRGFFNDFSFRNLQKVGGTFKVDFRQSVNNTWRVLAPNFKYVGNDLILIGAAEFLFPGDPRLTETTVTDKGETVLKYPDGYAENGGSAWDLNITKQLEHIGGNVIIVNFPMRNMRLQWGRSGEDGYWNDLPGGYGYCWIRQLIDLEVIDYKCKDVILGWSHAPFNLAQNPGCFDGVTVEGVEPEPLPAKGACFKPFDLGAVLAIKEVAIPVADFASVYPTVVSNGSLTIDSSVKLSKVEIVDMTGKTVLKTSNIGAGKQTISVASLSKGLYLVKLTSTNNNVKVCKIIR